MNRYFLELSYDGTAYCGWQVQPNGITIQEVLERCLSLQLGSDIKVTGAGRTDTGVHALQTFAHFDAPFSEIPDSFIYRLNSFLPPDIAVRKILAVTPEAHARFDALSRSYMYKICTGKNPFLINKALWIKQMPDIERMNLAAEYIKGQHDFSSFCSHKSDTENKICTVNTAEWRMNNDILEFHIGADRFVMNMVRSLTGTLLEVGSNKRNPQDLKEILSKNDRRAAGPNAAPYGLYLSAVTYPSHIFV